MYYLTLLVRGAASGLHERVAFAWKWNGPRESADEAEYPLYITMGERFKLLPLID